MRTVDAVIGRWGEECAKLLDPQNPKSDWTDYALTKAECARRIRERH